MSKWTGFKFVVAGVFSLYVAVTGIGLILQDGFFTVEQGVGMVCVFVAGKVLEDLEVKE